MFVRWLGAFRKSGTSLLDSIKFEVESDREAACEKFHAKSEIIHSRVGLLCDPSCVLLNFTKDCWSEYDQTKTVLHKTRNPRTAKSKHAESWVRTKNCFTGIVVKVPVDNLRKNVQADIREAAKLYNLPVYLLKEDKRARLVKVTL